MEDKFFLDVADVQKLLYQQLELLAEQSKKCEPMELAMLSGEMASVAKVLESLVFGR